MPAVLQNSVADYAIMHWEELLMVEVPVNDEVAEMGLMQWGWTKHQFNEFLTAMLPGMVAQLRDGDHVPSPEKARCAYIHSECTVHMLITYSVILGLDIYDINPIWGQVFGVKVWGHEFCLRLRLKHMCELAC